LQRERAAQAFQQRLRRLVPSLAGGLTILLFLALAVGLVSHAMSGRASDSVLASAAQGIAEKVGRPSSHTAIIRLKAPLGPGYPPAQVILTGSGFQPDELVQLAGALRGQTEDGQAASETLSDGDRASDGGELIMVRFTIPGNARFRGTYHLQIAATGDAGSTASLQRRAQRLSWIAEAFISLRRARSFQ